MARQPIYDRDMKLYAHELLFRRSDVAVDAQMEGEDDARSLIGVLVDIGLVKMIGDEFAFVNLSESLLLSGAVTMLPKDRVVLELLETIRPTPEVLQRTLDLRRAGYCLALDDYEFAPETEPLLEAASIVKVDVIATPTHLLRKHVQDLKFARKTVLAEKVETHEMHKLCMDCGFDYFQGYFFAKPELIRSHSIEPNKLALMRLAAKLQAPNVDLQDLEEIISTDVGLSFRLLKLVKSAHFGLPASVSSIRQTLMFLGLHTVSSLATLLTMTTGSHKPDELLTTALVRAKMCEQLASRRGLHPCESFFTVGLLSVIDAVLDSPMATVLEQLPLAPEINGALLGETNELRRTLDAVLAFERADWDSCALEGLDPVTLAKSYTKAAHWASSTHAAANAA